MHILVNYVALSLLYKLDKMFENRSYVSCSFKYSLLAEEQILLFRFEFFFNTIQTIFVPQSLPLSLHWCCQHCPPPPLLLLCISSSSHLLKPVQPLWVIHTWWIIKTFETHSVCLAAFRIAACGGGDHTLLNIAWEEGVMGCIMIRSSIHQVVLYTHTHTCLTRPGNNSLGPSCTTCLPCFPSCNPRHSRAECFPSFRECSR